MAYLKNIASAEVLKLADQVQYAAGQVVSKTLVQNKGVGITLFREFPAVSYSRRQEAR